MGAAFAQTAVILTLRSRRPDVVFASCAFLACCMSYESHIAIVVPIWYAWYAHRDRVALAIPIACTVLGLVFILADITLFGTGATKPDKHQIELGLHVVPQTCMFVGRLILTSYVSPVGRSEAPPTTWGNPTTPPTPMPACSS